MSDAIEWPEPWTPVKADVASRLEAELQRELPPGHVLAGVRVMAIAHRIDQDEVGFRLTDGPGAFAIVHLSYQVERDPRWPDTDVFATASDLNRQVQEDHVAYSAPHN